MGAVQIQVWKQFSTREESGNGNRLEWKSMHELVVQNSSSLNVLQIEKNEDER